MIRLFCFTPKARALRNMKRAEKQIESLHYSVLMWVYAWSRRPPCGCCCANCKEDDKIRKEINHRYQAVAKARTKIRGYVRELSN